MGDGQVSDALQKPVFLSFNSFAEINGSIYFFLFLYNLSSTANNLMPKCPIPTPTTSSSLYVLPLLNRIKFPSDFHERSLKYAIWCRTLIGIESWLIDLISERPFLHLLTQMALILPIFPAAAMKLLP